MVTAMFAINTYEEIEQRQRENNDKQIVILLFVRPTAPGAKEIIEEFDYIHYNSARYCSTYAVGYSNDFSKANEQGYKRAASIGGREWYFSNAEFVKFKDSLEHRIQWKYSGENELIILQSNPEGRQILNFQNYIAIDINHGIRSGYIDSFQRFMEALIRSSKFEVTAKEAVFQLRKNRYSTKDIIANAIDSCKKVPTPVKAIMKDKLFYCPALRSNRI